MWNELRSKLLEDCATHGALSECEVKMLHTNTGKQTAGPDVVRTHHHTPPPRLRPQQSRCQPPRNPSRAPPDLRALQKTLLPPYPRPHTSGQTRAWNTSDQIYDRF